MWLLFGIFGSSLEERFRYDAMWRGADGISNSLFSAEAMSVSDAGCGIEHLPVPTLDSIRPVNVNPRQGLHKATVEIG